MRKAFALLFVASCALPALGMPTAGVLQKSLAGRNDRFIEVPQGRGGASFIASSSTQTMRFGGDGIEILPRATSPGMAKSAGTVSLRYQFAGASTGTPQASSKASGIAYHFFIGSRANWAHDLKSYSSITYRGLWPGIDATYSGDAGGIKYHFDVAPGADAGAIRMIVRGADAARITEDGAIEWTVGGAVVRDEPPVAYQGLAGRESIVAAAFKLDEIDASTWSVALTATQYDRSRALTVDPAWTAFSGLVGGNAADQVYSVAQDAAGNTYACGITASNNLPTSSAYDSSFNGSTGDNDAFLVKFNSSGAPQFVTYFGGAAYDVCTGIAVNSADGSIYVAGGTTSTNFPFQGSSSDGLLARSKAGGDRDGFVAKFSSAGNSLLFSGVIGGSLDDQVNGLALDSSGNAYIAGYTMSSGFPRVGGANTLNGAMDAFAARVSSDGQTVGMSALIGGADVESAHGIAVSGDGSAIYVVGETASTSGFPALTGAFRTVGTGADGFVTAVNAGGTIGWSALLSGAACGGCTRISRALGVAIDPSDGNLLVVGETDSASFPISDAGTQLGLGGPQNANSGGMDGFLVRVNTTGTQVLNRTYLGGSAYDSAEGVAADGMGGIYVTGTVSASSSSFPTASTTGLSTSRAGAQDGFLSKLTSSTTLNLAYSGFLASSVNDSAHAISVAPGYGSGVVAVGGATSGNGASGFANVTMSALNASNSAANGIVFLVAPFESPLTIAAFSGSGQHAFLNASFGSPLVVQVLDATLAPVQGVQVTFSTPGSGASATLTGSNPVMTDSNGKAQISASANGTAGGYTISASAAGVSGTASFSLTNDKFAQTISFGALADHTYGDAPFTVSATATSGDAVSFGSTTTSICTVLGDTVTIVGTGQCTIQADQAGNASYAPAPSVTQSFNVSSATQSISFPAAGPQTFSPGGTFGVSATATSGLTVAITSLTTATCSVAGTTVTMVSKGTCTLAANQAGDSNYAAASQVTQDIGFHVAPGSIADLDGSGTSDLVWQKTDGSVAVWLMNGLSTTSSAEILGPGTGFQVAQIADFDGDGIADLLWQHPDGRVVMWLMNGTGHGGKTTLVPAGSGWSVAAVADLDGDGKADIVWQKTDGTVAVWLMNGVTTKAGATILGPGTGWSVARAADFNGDGMADLLFTHTDGRTAMWLMNGTTPTSTTELLGPGSGWTPTLTPDLNGDGRADIIWQNTDGSTSAWLMNGATKLSDASILPSGTGWSVTRTGDFNGDGKGDLLLTHTDGRVALYLMDGLTATATTQVLNASSGWTAKRVADLNGDGKSDIVLQHTDGSVAVWLMNGTSIASGASILGTGTGWSVSVAGQ